MTRGKQRQRWHCRPCNKTAFGSEARALESVAVLAAVSTRDIKPIRAYSCPFNNGWHMTSEEKRT